jgi:hypothetical protein
LASTQWYADFKVNLPNFVANHPEEVGIKVSFCADISALLMKGQRSEFELLDSKGDIYPQARTIEQPDGSYLLNGRGFIFSSNSSVTPHGDAFLIQSITVSSLTQERKFILGRDFARDHYPKLVYTITNEERKAHFEGGDDGQSSTLLPIIKVGPVTIYRV